MDHLAITNYAVGQPVVCVQAGRGDLTTADSNPTCRPGTPLRPFALAAGALCARASERAPRRSCPGLSMTSPVDKTAGLARPGSTPTSLVVAGSGAAATSTTKDAQ